MPQFPSKRVGGPVPRKPRVVLGGGLVRKTQVTKTLRVPRKKKQPTSWDTRNTNHAATRRLRPFPHVESSYVDRGMTADEQLFWTHGCSIGDSIIAKERMLPIYYDTSRFSAPVHPYLADSWHSLDNNAVPVEAGSVGIYAGTIRTLESGPKGSMMSVLRHTVIFASGRYVLIDLPAVGPLK